MAKTKKCTKCLVEKATKDFHKDRSKKDGLRFWCKECNIANIKNWTQKNPEHVKFLQRNADLKRYYGIDIDQYQKMAKAQNERCAICQTSTTNLVVDHCHKSNKTRDLLCNRCNRTLGAVEEKEEILRSMIQYLEKHRNLIL